MILPWENISKCCTVPGTEDRQFPLKYRGTEHQNCTICKHKEDCFRRKKELETE